MRNNSNKILLLAEFSNFGGTRTYFKELLNFYHNLNQDVLVVLDKSKKNDQEIIDLIKSYMLPIEFIALPSLKKKTTISKILNYTYNICSFSLLNLRFLDRTVVISGWSPYKFFSSFILPIKSINIVHSYPISKIPKILKFFIKKGISNRHLFVTVSNFSKESIKFYWLDNLFSNFVKVIYNFSELEDTPVRTIIRKIPVVLTLGRVTWYKNPQTWLAVAKSVNRIKKVNFVWAGDGDQLVELKEQNKQEGNEFVSFLGFQTDVEKLYAECNIYFQPSLLESFGLSIVEAMRRGIPVVASTTGGIPELIHSDKDGILVNPLDIDQMTNKILWLLDNDIERQKISKISLKTYKTNFSRKKWTDEFLKINHLINQ